MPHNIEAVTVNCGCSCEDSEGARDDHELSNLRCLWPLPRHAPLERGNKSTSLIHSDCSKGSTVNTGSNHIDYDNAAQQLWMKGSLHIAMSASKCASAWAS